MEIGVNYTFPMMLERKRRNWRDGDAQPRFYLARFIKRDPGSPEAKVAQSVLNGEG